MKIAIVGTGVSGLVAAHRLHPEHEITVYEAGDRLGGHTNTVAVTGKNGPALAIDTGFIVFNDRNYPNFEALLAVLDPDVVLRADETAVQLGAAPETRGAAEVAAFSRFARGAKSAFLDGAPAAAWMAAGRPRVVYDFTVSDGRIIAIDLIGDPDRLNRLDLAIVDQAEGPW